MKQRLVTLGLALGALALFYILFLPKPAAEDAAPALPLSTEMRPDGHLAAWRWLKAESIPVAALHERYDGLLAESAAQAPAGNVMLTILPHKLPVRPEEATALDRWVARGNTLVVMAAFDDTPAWALMSGVNLIDTAGRLTRLKFAVIDDGKAGAGDRPASQAEQRPVSSMLKSLVQSQNSIIEPLGDHPLLQGVKSVEVDSEFPASRWSATPMDRSGVLQIGRIAGKGDAAIWLRRQGKGQVITFAAAGIFSNRAIGQRDNARLLSNLIVWSRKSGAAVIFDDAHQGVVSYYDPKAFFADSRLHKTLAWIVLLWFVFVLGVQRLRTRVAAWNPADVTAFVAGSGDFFAATLTPAAAAERLLANFFNSIRGRLGLPQDGTPLWEWLSGHAAVSAGDLAELRRLHARLRDGRSVDLIRLQNLLVQLQGNVI